MKRCYYIIVACLTTLTLIIVLPERLAKFVKIKHFVFHMDHLLGYLYGSPPVNLCHLVMRVFQDEINTFYLAGCHLSGNLLASLPANAAGIAQKFTWPTCLLGCPKVAWCLVALLPKSLPGPPACLPASLPLTHLGLTSTACK